MTRKLAIAALMAILAAGAASAQTAVNGGDTAPLMTSGGTGFSLDLLADGGDSKGSFLNPATQSGAGWANMLGGAYAFAHGHPASGAITAVLEGGGLAALILGYGAASRADDSSIPMMVAMGGLVAAVGGAIHGIRQGRSIWASEHSKSASTGFGGNPLEHVSFSVVPDSRGGAAGYLGYSTKF